MPHKLIVLPENARLMVLGLVAAFLVVRAGLMFFYRGKTNAILPPGALRDYGLAGGAICPKCHRPFRLGLMSIKLGLGTKLARCEYCGNWSAVRRASLADLRAAESAEMAETQANPPVSSQEAAEKFKDLVEESRFRDLSK